MENSVILMAQGRLGNIMFQIAAANQYMHDHHKDQLFVDCGGHNCQKYYRILKQFSPPILYQPISYKLIKENNDQSLTQLPDYPGENVLMAGYFESEYYCSNRQLLNDLYKCPKDIEENIKNKHPYIDEYVGISIRRGDILNFKHIFKIVDTQWYLDMYHKYFDGRKVMVFSDDIEYCKDFFKNENFIYHKNNVLGNNRYNIINPEESLYTMGLCKDHICSMSTWSWWGARVCEKPGSINIFPDKKFTIQSGIDESNYIPSRWIQEKAKYEN